jgi:phosphomethylpyrimidine synthase
MSMTTADAQRARQAATAAVAEAEGVPGDVLRERVRQGRVVILGGPGRAARPLGLGEGLSTKVNANIGTSPDIGDLETEVAKAQAAVGAGADAIMDLSTGGELGAIRQAVRDCCDIALGTVPIYEAGVIANERYGSIADMPGELMLEAVKRHAEDGVDFMTIHCGVTQASVARLRAEGRVGGIVSRGGSILAHWMLQNGAENPLYARYDEVLDICREHDVALSLGDGLRPGALADATDRGQLEELLVIGELTERALQAGVQVFVEGPGHVPLNQIEANVVVMKRACRGVPFYVLGPLVTDVCPGYDHIVGAIGGALCAAAGADFLCYVTPAEHLGLPTEEDVIQGVIASRIAAHAADLVKGVPGAADWDLKMSQARRNLDWEAMTRLAIDPARVREVRAERASQDSQACSMCGSFCSLKRREV